ncbi:MAG: DUF4317 domain-containing protein [Lachnospiraceae bacterium]|nr:DUF4317 domain-containing protein [Lachnospiraceae bacterium]MBQ8317420.1 DUF4317 domain-containing protein [Lachnospiraceae bacterium]
MTKKEINEIKGLFDTIEECGIARLCGCYVNGDKEKVKIFSESFLDLEEKEQHKYLEIFRKNLSGTLGKNLIDLSFVDEEANDVSFGKGMLNAIKKSELKDEALLDRFYDGIINTYNHVGNYLILMIYQAYDVPGITDDEIEMEDASNEVYSYVLCSICPMKLTKPGLGYDDKLEMIHTLKQSFGVELPDTGFIFPAFNDRSSDDSQILYYTRRADDLQDKLLDELLAVSAPLPAKQQKEGFNTFVAEVLGEDSTIETMIAMQENFTELVKEKKEFSDSPTIVLDKDTVREVFVKSGVDETKLEVFDKKFDQQFDMEQYAKKKRVVLDEDEKEVPVEVPKLKVEQTILAENVLPSRNIEVKGKDLLLRINTKHMDIIDINEADGRKYLVIELPEDVKVNGISVS